MDEEDLPDVADLQDADLDESEEVSNCVVFSVHKPKTEICSSELLYGDIVLLLEKEKIMFAVKCGEVSHEL